MRGYLDGVLCLFCYFHPYRKMGRIESCEDYLHRAFLNDDVIPIKKDEVASELGREQVVHLTGPIFSSHISMLRHVRLLSRRGGKLPCCLPRVAPHQVNVYKAHPSFKQAHMPLFDTFRPILPDVLAPEVNDVDTLDAIGPSQTWYRCAKAGLARCRL